MFGIGGRRISWRPRQSEKRKCWYARTGHHGESTRRMCSTWCCLTSRGIRLSTCAVRVVPHVGREARASLPSWFWAGKWALHVTFCTAMRRVCLYIGSQRCDGPLCWDASLVSVHHTALYCIKTGFNMFRFLFESPVVTARVCTFLQMQGWVNPYGGNVGRAMYVVIKLRQFRAQQVCLLKVTQTLSYVCFYFQV